MYTLPGKNNRRLPSERHNRPVAVNRSGGRGNRLTPELFGEISVLNKRKTLFFPVIEERVRAVRG
jgi:hypothetical protein